MLTVITPATNRRLASPELVAAELGCSNDPLLLVMIEQASDAVRAWCGRVFELETVRETFDRFGLWGGGCISRWPLVEIVSSQADAEPLDPTLVEADQSTGIIRIRHSRSSKSA